jgi:predicted nucleotidyltransferase
MGARLPFNRGDIADFCQRWLITELSLFGSVLRDDFRPDSDVDVLVTFAADAPWSLLDLVAMREQLRHLFGREVHLVEQAGLRNPFRRHAILNHREVIFAA